MIDSEDFPIPPQLLDPSHPVNLCQKRTILAVTTQKPSMSAMTAGALAMVDPQAGSVSSSLTISGDLSSMAASQQQQQLGVSSLSLFPTRFSNLHSTNHSTNLAIAYGGRVAASQKGGNNNNNNDCAAMLVSLHPSHPKVYWKARLPEANLTTAGIVVSQCGHYAIAGGASGCLYVWYTLSGELVKTVRRAHYRSVSCVCVVSDRFIVTGGQDGMVHLWALRDLVNDEHDYDEPVMPLRTWAQHAVPITAVALLTGPDTRIVSASQDGMILVLETFSEQVLAQIHVPEGVSSLAVSVDQTQCQRIWVGGQLGTIFCLDLDQYSMHQTIQLGAHIPTATKGGAVDTATSVDAKNDSTTTSQQLSYKTTLTGHLDAVTSIVTWHDDARNTDYVASGDAMGTLRIWDVDSRVCVRVVRPWSTASAAVGPTATEKKKSSQQHSHNAISSIVVLEVPDEESTVASSNTPGDNPFLRNGNRGSGGGGGAKSKAAALTDMLPPLQKYPTPPPGEDEVKWTPIFLWQSNMTLDKVRSRADIALEKADQFIEGNPWRAMTKRDDSGQCKKRKGSTVDSNAAEAMETDEVDNEKATGSDDDNDEMEESEQKDEELKALRDQLSAENDKDEELKRLRKQLEEANSTIDRWQKVNNELVAKLKKKPTKKR